MVPSGPPKSHITEPLRARILRSRVMVRVATICTGNICRSPMAEVVLAHLVSQQPALAGQVVVSSAGTAAWHVGRAMDARARRALDRAGFSGPGTLAAWASPDYLDSQDVIIVMTREHRDEVRLRTSGDPRRVILLRAWDGSNHALDLADPYYGTDRDFDRCLEVIEDSLRSLVTSWAHQVGGRQGWPVA